MICFVVKYESAQVRIYWVGEWSIATILVGLSIPDALSHKKVMAIKMIAILFGIVTMCIIFSGYLLTLISPGSEILSSLETN
jgi:hypothetical protein